MWIIDQTRYHRVYLFELYSWCTIYHYSHTFTHRTWMPRMDNLVNRYRQKWEPTIREHAGEAIRIINEEKKKLEQEADDKNNKK